MELITKEIEAFVRKYGEETDLVIPAGQRIRIETSPGGAEVLDETVPAGKQWTATISVSIDEVDV